MTLSKLQEKLINTFKTEMLKIEPLYTNEIQKEIREKILKDLNIILIKSYNMDNQIEYIDNTKKILFKFLTENYENIKQTLWDFDNFFKKCLELPFCLFGAYVVENPEKFI